MKVEIELSREQIEDTLQGVLGACFSHWNWWQLVEYEEGFDWKTYPADLEEKFLTVGIEDPAYPEDLLQDEDDKLPLVEKKLSVADILRAWSVCSVKGYQMSDEDAVSSDAVMQTAVLGEVTYG
jgi:hypothetical protein